MHRIGFASTGIAMLAVGIACAVDADEYKDFAGAWVIRSSSVAPWKDPKNPLGESEPGQLIGKTVTFAANAVSGPAPIGCAKPVYKVETVGPDMIFEGQLAEPKDYAKNPGRRGGGHETRLRRPAAHRHAGCRVHRTAVPPGKAGDAGLRTQQPRLPDDAEVRRRSAASCARASRH